jgi:hypothetical protein
MRYFLGFAVAVATVTGWVSTGTATTVPGGGPASSDCYSVFDVQDAPTPSGNKVECTDGDPCDTDGACNVNRKCTFKVRVCINQTGVGSCTPKDVKKLIGGGGLSKPSTPSSAAVCGDYSNVTVALKGKKAKMAKKMIKLTAVSATGKPKKDADTLVLVCKPQPGICTTTTTSTSTTTTTLPTVCDCCDKTIMSFTTGLPSATKTGEILDDSGVHVTDLTSGGLYFGGGLEGVPLPAAVPASGNTQTAITACNSSTGDITIGSRTSAQTGSNANCSAVGCLFGPPLPIPNPTGTSTSTCVVNVVSANATGSGNCNGNIASLNLPLASGIYLTGDLEPSIDGIQPCPICTGGTCKGGPNDGLACTPGTATPGADYPTSNDCPPPVSGFLGNLPIAFDLSTGLRSKTAFDNLPTQTNIFCGYCSSNAGVPENVGGAAHPCTSNSDCTTGIFTKCRQKDGGAFSTDLLGLNTARTITETGTPSACLADGAGHSATLVSVFCTAPTFNGIVDGSADLGGPGAVSLPGTSQLLP